MNEEEIYFGTLWDTLDFLAEHPFAPASQVIVGMKDLIKRDPEGAALRARALPQYDLDRFAAAVGGEHEPTPDGGGDSGRPHPQDRFALAAPEALADCD
jgi:hypothetical protein